MREEPKTPVSLSGETGKKDIHYCLHCGRPFESVAAFEAHQKSLVEINRNQAVVNLRFQPYFQPETVSKEQFYQAAVSSDHVTITSWLDTWLKHIEENCKRFDVHKHSIMSEAGKWAYKPAICAGSGPSLRKNSKWLKPASASEWPGISPQGNPMAIWPGRGDIGMISCLHNFAYFEDNKIPADYYVNLDAGDITLRDMVSGGREKDPDHYWNLTKDRTLVTALVGHPELISKWKGPVLFFNTACPDPMYISKQKELTKSFNVMASTGGNALGACLYIARAFLGANPLVFIGANFAFDYDEKFYAFDSENQKFSGISMVSDVYGNKVGTWPSYRNFAQWFSYISCGGKGNNPISMINCTEGGILGAYEHGNIGSIRQMSLSEFLYEYHAHKLMPDMLSNKDMFNFLF